MSEPSFLSWGDVPHRTDTVNTLLKRIAGGIANGGGGGGSVQVIADSFADPNGNVTPDDPASGAVYTQDGAGIIVVWRWDVTAQLWRQLLG